MRYLLTILILTCSAPVGAIDLDGQTDFARKLDLNASISARVAGIEVAPGDRVAIGSLLVTLVDTGYRANVDHARARVDALAPRVMRMQTELDKAEELFDRDSLALVELQIAEQDHAIALANLLAAQANLNKAEFELSQTLVRSPMNAMVLRIAVNPGQFINTRVSDTVLVTLVEDERMIARAFLPAEHWDRNLLGQEAAITLPRASYRGKVVALGKETVIGNNNHPAVEIKIEFEANGDVPANLPVRISIED